MGRKATELECKFEVEFVTMPAEHVAAYRAGLQLLLEILQLEVIGERMGIDLFGDDQRGIPALLPMDEVFQG